MPDEKGREVESSDIQEINRQIDRIREKSHIIKDKAFELHRPVENPAGLPTPGEVEKLGDFASNIKGQLDHIADVLQKALESLTAFAG